jgi:hypothetical protein
MKPLLYLVALGGALLLILKRRAAAAAGNPAGADAGKPPGNVQFGDLTSVFAKTDVYTDTPASEKVVAAWYGGDGKVVTVLEDGSTWVRPQGAAVGDLYTPPLKRNP